MKADDLQFNPIVGQVDKSNMGLKIMIDVKYSDLSPEFRTFVSSLIDAEEMGELGAVMQLGIDKWLEGKELEDNPATRACTAREKVLKIIEKLENEVRLKSLWLEECISTLETISNGPDDVCTVPNVGLYRSIRKHVVDVVDRIWAQRKKYKF